MNGLPLRNVEVTRTVDIQSNHELNRMLADCTAGFARWTYCRGRDVRMVGQKVAYEVLRHFGPITQAAFALRTWGYGATPIVKKPLF